jgi:hypothetical protein
VNTLLQCMSPHLAPFGHVTMSDLSPQSDPKRTLLGRSTHRDFYEYTPKAPVMPGQLRRAASSGKLPGSARLRLFPSRRRTSRACPWPMLGGQTTTAFAGSCCGRRGLLLSPRRPRYGMPRQGARSRRCSCRTTGSWCCTSTRLLRARSATRAGGVGSRRVCGRGSRASVRLRGPPVKLERRAKCQLTQFGSRH